VVAAARTASLTAVGVIATIAFSARLRTSSGYLFYREGINATGVARLANGASVSKRTLHQHFPSKTAVVEEYLRCIQRRVGDRIRPGADSADRTPRERILALFETPSPNGQMRGCPFHNAAVEASEVMPEIHDIVHEHKRAYIKGLIKLARQAGAATLHCWATNSALSMKVQPHCRPLSTTRLRGHTHLRRRRRSSM
jgi:AcrR family transcriptional regulator